MPEGDVIHGHARRLAPRLVGQPITLATTQGVERDLAGRTITAVHAVGKHLLIDLDDGTRIRTHLAMTGRVREYAPADAADLLARRSPGTASLVLATPDVTVVWWRAPTVEIAARRAPHRDVALAKLGPDLLAAEFDPAAAAARAELHGSRMILDVLLDQRVVAGIGNIYKNESLAEERVDPRTPVAQLSRAELVALYTTAQRLMSHRGRRGHARLVYGRTGEPCARCGTRILRAELGDPARTTWWCPQCQAPGARAGANR